ncbi:hypothetical protein, partial [Vibrio parahaemolyticus]|uniref:hypothetical protein n=1 Tax=Vibrio parahaemolyticus TaxID=670 RepID=UPI00116F1AFB
MILANCPKDAFPIVNNYFLYTTKKTKSISVRAHIIETTNTDFYSVGVKYGLQTNNAGMTYSINGDVLGTAIENLNMLFSFDKFSSLISVLESD